MYRWVCPTRCKYKIGHVLIFAKNSSLEFLTVKFIIKRCRVLYLSPQEVNPITINNTTNT